MGIFDVACMGTSLSSSWSCRNWPQEAERLLQVGKRERVRFYQVGQIGQISRWGLANVKDITNKRPRAVLIEFNTNDCFLPDTAPPADLVYLPEARSNTIGMIDAVRAARADTYIFLMTMNPVNPGWSGNVWRTALPQYHGMYRELAVEKSVGLIDNYPEWVARGEPQGLIDTPDGTHPEIAALRQVLIPNVIEALSPLFT